MLVLRWIRWWMGYVVFEIRGADPHRFLTGAAARGYSLWRMKKLDETCCTACVAVGRYRELRAVAKKRRLRLRVVKRCGFPFVLRKWLHSGKQGVFFGALGALVLLCVLSTRVWVINVSGNTALSTEEIKAAAAEFGLGIGVDKNGYNPKSIENQLMLQYPEISWVTVNTWANTVNIVIEEGIEKPEVEESGATGNVTASQSGQVVSMEVYSGKSRVKVGDGVAAGQLLVSGVLENDQGGVSFTKARAKIMARTRRQFTVTVPMEEVQWEDTGDVVERKSVRLFGLVIPLTLSGTPEGDYEKSTASESVTVNGVELPMTICTETYREQTGVTVSVSEAEARQRGIEAIQKQQAETLDDPEEPGSVLSEHVTVTAKNGYYTIESDCLCLENIAREQPFYVELEEGEASSETASGNI